MKYTIEVETSDDFESCNDCIYSEDTEEICILRRCAHAIKRLKECYKPRPSIPLPYTVVPTTTCQSVCAGCYNNPANGGSGVCHCIIGTSQIT